MLFYSGALRVVIGLVGYQLLQMIARALVLRISPSFFANLRQDPAFKLRPYFVFPVGFILTLLSVPFCARAFVSTSNSTDSFCGAQSLSRSEEVCLASRAVLWTSELPLLSFSSEYIAHHILALSSLGTVIFANLPRRPLYLIYTGLVTELVSDSICVLRYHGWSVQNSKLFRSLTLMNALCLVGLRIVPALGFGLATFMPATSVQPAIYLSSIIFYCGYLLTLVYKQLASLGYAKLVRDKPGAFLRVMGYDVHLYGIMLGSAMVATQTSTALIYINVSDRHPLTHHEITSMATTGLGSVVAGLVGARLLNRVLDSSPRTPPSQGHEDNDDGAKALVPGPSHGSSRAYSGWAKTILLSRFTCSESGISIQGAALSATVFVALTNTIATTVDKPMILSSMALSLTLGEAIGRIGCYLGGCCGSSRSHGKEFYPALPLLASVMNATAFIAIAPFVLGGTLDPHEAGSMSMISNAAIRLAIEPQRASSVTEGGRAAHTTIFAFAQLIVSFGICFTRRIALGHSTYSALGITTFYTVILVFATRQGRNLWSYQAHTKSPLRSLAPRIARPLSAVALFATVIFSLAIKDSLRAFWNQNEQLVTPRCNAFGDASTGNPWVLSSPTFLANLLITGSIPLLAGSGGISKCGSRR